MDKNKAQSVVDEIDFVISRIALIQSTIKESRSSVGDTRHTISMTRKTNNAMRELSYIKSDLNFYIECGEWPMTVSEIQQAHNAYRNGLTHAKMNVSGQPEQNKGGKNNG